LVEKMKNLDSRLRGNDMSMTVIYMKVILNAPFDLTRSSARHPCASRGPEKDQTEDWIPACVGTTDGISRAGNTTTPQVTGLSFPGWALKGMTVPAEAGIQLFTTGV